MLHTGPITIGFPRCARDFRKSLQRYIPMLLWRIFIALGLEHLQRVDQLFARFLWADHSVDVATFGGNVRAGKAVTEFFNLFIACLGNDFSFFLLGFS